MTRRRPPRSTSADDLLTTLGRLTAQAREGAELQHARVELAEALQRDMLPARLPAVPGLRTAARYAPSQDGLDIGGDWYDGFALSDGSLAFSVGDVQGHDVEAAAFMGQVRIGLRAVAASAHDPGEVLSLANDLLMSVDSGLFATCTFLRFDPVRWEIQSARAGHVASVWATVDGWSGCAEDEGGLPLGIMAGEKYPVTRRPLLSAGAFVLLTDGVVEGPSFPIEEGMARVARAVEAGVSADPGDLAAEVMKVAELTGHTDDAAVLVLRHDGPPGAQPDGAASHVARPGGRSDESPRVSRPHVVASGVQGDGAG
ncbi:PP2C family protein-serine/threonine phosphatase [Streptomyces sp. NPDC057617]|uniref:PP2C family protein-serine/threonine phosphatase n=1 Tax=unclassified Streptomyces TaxID=2593676 RepID=UPI0036ABA21C